MEPVSYSNPKLINLKSNYTGTLCAKNQQALLNSTTFMTITKNVAVVGCICTQMDYKENVLLRGHYIYP